MNHARIRRSATLLLLLAGIAAPSPSLARGTSAAELALWNDPAFRARLVESYVAETEIEPTLTKKEREQMLKVLELIGADDRAGAEKMLRERGGAGASAVFDFTLANLHFQDEELPEAAEAYEIAVGKHPKFRRAWRNLGLVRVRQSEFDAARTAFAKVIELGGGDALTYGLLGFACASVEDALAAESAYRMAIVLDPATLDWRLGLARSLFRQERFADAAALCDRLIENDPERAELWLLQANAWIGLGRPLDAARNFEIVDGLGASTPASLAMLADIYVNEELADLGAATYLRALEGEDPVPPARVLRAARVMASRGGLDEAALLLDRLEGDFADALDPGELKDLLKLRARIAVARDASEDEVRALEEIVALDPLDGEALILLGRQAARSGDPDRAILWFERAARLEAHEADAKVRHAEVLVRLGSYDDAVPLLRRAQTLRPREAVQSYLEKVERFAKTR